VGSLPLRVTPSVWAARGAIPEAHCIFIG
jgi:hypothetical protein